MCLYSEEAKTRDLSVGESTSFGAVQGTHDGTITGALPPANEGQGRNGIKCLCIRDGSILALTGLSSKLVNELGLTSTEAVVTFHQGIRGRSQDKFEFANTSTANLDKRFIGVGVNRLAVNLTDYLAQHRESPGLIGQTGAGKKTKVPAVAIAPVSRRREAQSIVVAALTAFLLPLTIVTMVGF